MGQVSAGTVIGSYFLKWEDEDKKGFVKALEHSSKGVDDGR